MAPHACLIIRPVPFERNWIMAAVICPLRLQAWSCWHFALVGDLIMAMTVFFFPCCICLSSYFLQAHKGVNGCTVVTGSSLDGHSSMKVWGQHTQVSIPSSSSSTLTLLLENRPPCPCDPNSRIFSSMTQMILFAVICIFVNLAMRYLPPSMHDLFLVARDIGCSAIKYPLPLSSDWINVLPSVPLCLYFILNHSIWRVSWLLPWLLKKCCHVWGVAWVV